jgi:glucose/arabinose dehydrogenase
MRVAKNLLLSSALALALAPVSSRSQTYVNAFPGATFTRPVWLGEVPGKPDNFLVLEQPGQAQIAYKNGGSWAKKLFVSIKVEGGTEGGSEQGLLGFAFHPHYADNGKYYVYYMRYGEDVLEERVADNTRLASDTTVKPRELFSPYDPESNHNGGTMAFGKDGFLYIGLGDGGGGGDAHEPPNAQNKDALFGKFLRIDVDHKANGKEYAIPSDNPFASGGGAPEVWAYGVRNPWKWSFDPVNDDLWVGDVGQNEVEEVSIIKKGGNYGWNEVEGDRCYIPGCKLSDYLPPVYAFTRSMGGSCVNGGVVYRGDPASPHYGSFLFGDHATGNVWSLKSDGKITALKKSPADGLSSFNVDSHQAVYVMGVFSTLIYKMTGTGFDATPTQMIPRRGLLRGTTGRTITAEAGAPIDFAALGEAPDRTLEIRSLAGARLASLSPVSPRVPKECGPGLYLLVSGSEHPDLLVVR